MTPLPSLLCHLAGSYMCMSFLLGSMESYMYNYLASGQPVSSSSAAVSVATGLATPRFQTCGLTDCVIIDYSVLPAGKVQLMLLLSCCFLHSRGGFHCLFLCTMTCACVCVSQVREWSFEVLSLQL